MSYIVYEVIHLCGVFLIITSLGAIASHCLQGGNRKNFKNRKFFAILHGLGLFLAFVAGFGLIAKGGYSFSSGWIYVKILVWISLGIYPMIFYRQKAGDKKPFLILLGLLFIAILFVQYKFF